MVRFMALYNAPEDPEAFDRYYEEVHVPLAKQLPGLIRFTVSKNVTTFSGAKYHLIAELDWESMESMQAAFASPIGAETAADVPKFASGGASTLIFEVAEV